MSYLNSKLDKTQSTYNWPVIMAFTFFLAAVVLFATAKLMNVTPESLSYPSAAASIQALKPTKADSFSAPKRAERVLPEMAEVPHQAEQHKENTKQMAPDQSLKRIEASASVAPENVTNKTTVKQDKQISVVSDDIAAVNSSEQITSQPASNVAAHVEAEKAGFFCSSNDHDAGLCE